MENALQCRVCGTVNGSLHSHHIIPKSLGGPDDASNRMLLCSDCHYKVHHSDDEDGDIAQFNDEYRQFIDTNILSDGWGMIPNKVLHDGALTPFAKVLYSELSSLAANRGYCWATNKYLADKFGVHPDTVSKTITTLSKYVVFENRASDRRRIWVHTLKSTPRRLRQRKVGKNTEHNNTTSNNINNTRDTLAPFSLEDTLKRWESGGVRRMDILAWYFRKAKFIARTKKELDNLIHRHISAASRLEVYTDDELVEGWKKASELGKKLNFTPTLETVLRQLTQ